VGTLAWTVEQTLDHLVDVFVWYAVQRACLRSGDAHPG
jgi:hypothetical protein